ncbi:3-deoxy-D-manno-octulosonic acid transferase [Thermodesulfobacteriota bacterium]
MKAVNVFLFLYNFAWTLVLIFSLPLMLLTKGWRLSGRLGLRIPAVARKRKSIWVHALSVGEVISALPVIRSIKQQYPSAIIVFTVKTSQGMKIARHELEGEVDLLLPMPLDFWWSVGRLIRYIRPSLLILVETDIWPGLIFYLQKRGIKVILINGRVSPRTFRAYKRGRFFTRIVLGAIELCLMQSDLDSKRLLELGISSQKIKTVGNIKFDRPRLPMEEKERDYWLDLLHLRPENRVWVAGSTHDGEDEIVLDTFRRLGSRFPELRLIIAPRKPERTEDIYRLSRFKGLRTLKRTDLGVNEGYSYQVLILNTIGELGRVYGLADVSFVGGSMVPVGGHNLLEPAGFGCPVIFGIHTHNFVLMSQLLLEAGGGRRVRDEEELYVTIKGLFSDPERSDRMALKGKEFVEKNRGAVERVMNHIGGYIEAA